MKNLAYIQDAYKQAVLDSHDFLPPRAAEAMLQGSMAGISQYEWDKVLTFINTLEFPLTVYRGLKNVTGDDVNLSPAGIGTSWTTDPELFDNEHSHFKDSNYILVGDVTDEQIDWNTTIQHYILYSLKSISTRYPENEIRLHYGTTPSDLQLVPKEVMFI